MNREHEDRAGGKSAARPRTMQTGGRASGEHAGAGEKVDEPQSRVGKAVREAGAQAQEAVSSLGSRANSEARRLADRQLSMGAEIVGDVADAVRTAAERLERNEPQIAHLARKAADKLDDFSDAIGSQSAEELWQASTDFARRRPAAVFGATAALGFLLVRLLHPGTVRSGNSGDGEQGAEQHGDQNLQEPGGIGPSGYAPAQEVTGGLARRPGGGPVYGG
jgi:ElaB/YqjD/DUF883 family membrane-anchored ribosome-binding protein